jgi:hypothetical protein
MYLSITTEQEYEPKIVGEMCDYSLTPINLSRLVASRPCKFSPIWTRGLRTVLSVFIVKPEWVDVEEEHGNVRKEKWPKRPLIVTGSRDHSLRVWNLPRPNEPEYRFEGRDEGDPADARHFFTVRKFPWPD